MVFDVTEADFQTRVLERSQELPVLVDFWAAWCGPCRVLGPVLEQAVGDAQGKLELAKVDVDSNQQLAQTYGVRGIPAVKAFRDGKVVDEFVGALPQVKVEQFVDKLLPSEADGLVAAGDEASLRRALAIEPRRPDAAIALARILLERGEAEAALELAEPLEGNFIAEGIAARARLTLGAGPNGEVGSALGALKRGETEAGLESLMSAFDDSDPDTRELVRKAMVGIFAELGAGDALATIYRRRLATKL
jgi:putative thioredoxin